MNDLTTLIRKEMNITVTLEPDTPLISSGFINSFRVTRLLVVLENHYQVAIEPAEIGVDNFDTIEQIYRLIQSKQQPAAST